MPEYDNSNRGAVWKNDRKETENHPDFKGSINVDGKDYWLSGWKRKPDASPNSPALSLSVQAKEQQTAQPGQPKTLDNAFDEDGSIPF